MATIAEVEKLALDLPETERAALAAHLLGSLPSVLHDEDEGIAEALRRDAEFEANPSLGMTSDELYQRIESLRSVCGLSFIRRSRRPQSPSTSIFWIQASIGVWPSGEVCRLERSWISMRTSGGRGRDSESIQAIWKNVQAVSVLG